MCVRVSMFIVCVFVRLSVCVNASNIENDAMDIQKIGSVMFPSRYYWVSWDLFSQKFVYSLDVVVAIVPLTPIHLI